MFPGISVYSEETVVKVKFILIKGEYCQKFQNINTFALIIKIFLYDLEKIEESDYPIDYCKISNS